MRLNLAALLTLLPALALTSPVVSPNGIKIPLTRRTPSFTKGTIDMSTLHANLAQARAKILRGMDNYKMNTGITHPSDKRNFIKRAAGAVPLIEGNNEQLWYGTITVGTPPNDFTVDFDTGSSDLFLPSPECQDSNCEGHNIYDPSASSTAVDQGRTVDLGFGDMSTVSIGIFTDTVNVGGLTATNQGVGTATQYSSGFALRNFPADGLMGMAFPVLARSGTSPVFQTLVAQAQTDEPVFAFTLADTGSELYVGGVDTSKFRGDITYVPVTTVAFWQVVIDSFQLDGNAIKSDIAAIVDTGTTLLIGDPNSVGAFYAGIPGVIDNGDGTYSLPCDSTINPSLTFQGRQFVIPSNIFLRLTNDPQVCMGGLTSAAYNPENGLWLIGDTFLRSVYTIFDVGNTRVGFAELSGQ